MGVLLKCEIMIAVACCLGCECGRLDSAAQWHLTTDDRCSDVRSVSSKGWYTILGTKDNLAVYRIQVDCDRDLGDVVRRANNRENLGKKIKCHLRLTHSELSDVLDTTLTVPCTMTCRPVESYKMSTDRDLSAQASYPASVHETWGWGELRWFRFKRRFDLVFVLEIKCFESKEDAIIAQALDSAASEFCTGYSVSGNVVCNVLTQSDYYVSISISLIAYKSSDGTPVLLDVKSRTNEEHDSVWVRRKRFQMDSLRLTES